MRLCVHVPLPLITLITANTRPVVGIQLYIYNILGKALAVGRKLLFYIIYFEIFMFPPPSKHLLRKYKPLSLCRLPGRLPDSQASRIISHGGQVHG